MVAVANRVRPDINMTPEGVATTIRKLRIAVKEGRATAGQGEVKHLARLEALLKEEGFGHLVA